MTPYAIMTPGGIADQFTRGLSGVAQAFAQRSQIDRQAKQDALAQARQEQDDIRAAEYLALAQQDRENAALRLKAEAERQAKLDAEALKQREIENAGKYGIGGNYVGTDPVSVAGRSYLDKQRFDQAEAERRSAAEAMRNFATMTRDNSRPVIVQGPNGPMYVSPSEALGKAPIEKNTTRLPSFVEMNAEIRKANQTIAELRRQKQVMRSDWTADQEASLTDAINQYNGLQDYIRNNAQAYGLTGAAGALANPPPPGKVPKASPMDVLNQLNSMQPR